MGGYLSGITVFLDNEVEISKVQSLNDLNGWLKPVGIGAFSLRINGGFTWFYIYLPRAP